MNEDDDTMVYADEPDITALSYSYETTVDEAGTFRGQCIRNRENRRNQWAGKSDDLRKNGENAFPWKGASDQEVHVIGQRLDDIVALCVGALDGSHTKALAGKIESLPRANQVAEFAKWMRTSDYIRNFDSEHEKAVNHLLEKKMMVTYVGWKTAEMTYKQEMSLQEIAATVPDVAELIAGGGYDDELAQMLIGQWPKLKPAKAKKAIRQLREKGFAELYVTRVSLMDSRPYVKTCAPDTEVFFPSYCRDPQESPYVFLRQLYTVQQIEEKVTTEGWDRDWANHIIECYRGIGVTDIAFEEGCRDSSSGFTETAKSDELILVVDAYQKLIDPDDGSLGIYCTTFNPYYTGDSGDAPAHAKRELMNGYSQYPFIATRMSEESDQFYDGTALAEKLRGPQWQIKVEVDSRTDRNSMATLPTRYGPHGKPPAEWGPGRYVGVRRDKSEYGYFDPPTFDPGSQIMEQAMHKLADRIAGVDPENPLTPARQKFVVNKTLKHASKVLKLAYTCFQRFGPDQIFFNVTGSPDPITMDNIEDDEFQFSMSFDSLANDPDTAKSQLEAMVSVMQFDTPGRIDKGKMIEFICHTISPSFASAVLLPAEENQQKVVKSVTEDLSKIWAGIEVGAQPNGAQIAMQVIQAWTQQPDVAQALQSNESLQARAKKYADQYQMQITQAKNATIGRLGTAPATFQGFNVA